jgi:hypothetical protein
MAHHRLKHANRSYFRIADDPEVLAVMQFDVATHLGDG